MTSTFQAVDPATGQAPQNPQVGFLPIDNMEGDGEGFVSYAVQAKSRVKTGDTVSARATDVDRRDRCRRADEFGHDTSPVHGPYNHFIEVSAQASTRPKPLQIARDLGAEFQRPVPNGFVANVGTALNQQRLHIPKTQGNPEIQPDRMTDDVGRKTVPFERNRLWNQSAAALLRP